MKEVVNIINAHVLPHWPFVAATIVLMMIGQVMSKSVFPKHGWHTKKPVWFFYWGRKTLPLHPVIAGVVLGIFWRSPEAGLDRVIESVGYFALAGACSVWCYEIIKGFAKSRGIDLRLPGVDDSSIPPRGE